MQERIAGLTAALRKLFKRISLCAQGISLFAIDGMPILPVTCGPARGNKAGAGVLSSPTGQPLGIDRRNGRAGSKG
ncbi:MAG TPA: hypothetical protein VMB34_23290 [Acetobacteraceae bacterium]|nr:hypothetical protein [Acetobacteraceae bacterium]